MRRCRPGISTISSTSRCCVAQLHAALTQTPELTFDQVARRVVTACGLGIRDIARNTELDPQSQAAQDVWRVFTDLTEYRLYEDLRRGWRVVQPNLEHVGLLRVGYRSLESLCADNTRWQFHPAVAAMPAAERETIIRAVLDQFRRKLAISCRCLHETTQQQIRRRAEQHLNEFWGLDPDVNELRTAERYVRLGQSTRLADGFSLSERSAIGKFLRQRFCLSTGDYVPFLDALIGLLLSQGFLVRLDPVDDHQFYQLDAACLLWRLGDGTPPLPDPMYSRRSSPPVNAFFQRFYRESSAALAALEAREHTAQVVKRASGNGASAVSVGKTAIPGRKLRSAGVCRTWSARPRWNLAWTSQTWIWSTCETCLPPPPTMPNVAAEPGDRGSRGWCSRTAVP